MTLDEALATDATPAAWRPPGPAGRMAPGRDIRIDAGTII
jgi:hypothetical protein